MSDADTISCMTLVTGCYERFIFGLELPRAAAKVGICLAVAVCGSASEQDYIAFKLLL